MEVQRHIGYEIRETDNYIRRFFDRKQNEMGFEKLTFAQTGILHYMFCRRDADIYQKDLENRFGIRRSTATGILQGLEKNGYIERESDCNDGRMKRIILTSKAVAREEAVHKMFGEGEDFILTLLSDEEKEALISSLRKIREAIKEKEDAYDQKTCAGNTRV